MKLRLFLVLSLIILTLTLAGCWGFNDSLVGPEREERYELEHNVTGEFLEEYQKAPDPLSIYGFPISVPFLDEATHRQVQYFQKARFELHPEQPLGQRVQISPLGEFLYTKGEAVVSGAETSPACSGFPNGYKVCHAFLEYFNTHGGIDQFGNPISNMEHRNGRIVQHFQKARFEWRPELPPGKRVVLSDLGAHYFYAIREDPFFLLPDEPISGIIHGITHLTVRAFPHRAVTGQSGIQTIHIIVQDQRLSPVENARATIVFELPSGEKQRYIIPDLTDAQGITQYSFPFDTQLIGVAKIHVTATLENLEDETVTSFRVWR